MDMAGYVIGYPVERAIRCSVSQGEGPNQCQTVVIRILAFQFQRPENGHVAAVTTDQQRSSSPAQFLFMVA